MTNETSLIVVVSLYGLIFLLILGIKLFAKTVADARKKRLNEDR